MIHQNVATANYDVSFEHKKVLQYWSQVPEHRDDFKVWQKLPVAKQVVQQFDIVGPLRNLEDRVRAVSHEGGGREQKSGSEVDVIKL